jgi:hypothetical protein
MKFECSECGEIFKESDAKLGKQTWGKIIYGYPNCQTDLIFIAYSLKPYWHIPLFLSLYILPQLFTDEIAEYLKPYDLPGYTLGALIIFIFIFLGAQMFLFYRDQENSPPKLLGKADDAKM